MDKLIFSIAAISLMVACSKDIDPNNVIGEDDILVSVEESQVETKTVLKDNTTTLFSSGDKILVYDTAGKKAVYKYRTRTGGKTLFQKESGDEGFEKTNFEAAFYPADSVDSYSSKVFTAHFSAKQKCANGSFPSGAAPLISFSKDGDAIKFSNCFAVIRFGFKYESVPSKPLTMSSIEVSNSTCYLSGTFEFGNGSVTYKSGGEKKVKLTDCDKLGALGTTDKYYYLALPGLTAASSEMTVTATPTTDVAFSGTFTATNNSTNKIAKNNILLMNSFVLKPVETGGSSSYTLNPWDASNGKIMVGQITLSNTEVKVKTGASADIQVFGASSLDDLKTNVLSGDSYFSMSKKKDGDKYYVTVTGKTTAGSGQGFVSDLKTNSGSYINVTVTN